MSAYLFDMNVKGLNYFRITVESEAQKVNGDIW